MAPTATRAAAAAVTVAILATGPLAFAAPADVPTVAVHVTDYAQVGAGELDAAEQLAGRAYARIGVRVVWADGNAAEATVDSTVHLDVAILTAAMTEQRRAPANAFAQARYQTRRAWLYYGRIAEHAFQTRGNPDRMLALVLAHEVGHLLIPEYSHARSGLMRAEWQGRIVTVPDFLPAEAATIRTMLLAGLARLPSIEP